MKHAVYMPIKEFLSKKAPTTPGVQIGGGGGSCPVLKHLCFGDRYREQKNKW